jgi:hypothetical protein
LQDCRKFSLATPNHDHIAIHIEEKFEKQETWALFGIDVYSLSANQAVSKFILDQVSSSPCFLVFLFF